MATTKRTTRSTARKSTMRKQDDGLVARTGRTIRDRPYTSAAIATGAVTAVAAAAAGAFFFSRREKSLAETAEDVKARVKDGMSEAGSKLSDAGGRVKEMAKRASDKFDGHASKSQSDIAAEALTLKETGTKAPHPSDPTIDEQLKAGAVAH